MRKNIKNLVASLLRFCTRNQKVSNFIFKNLRYSPETADQIVRNNRDMFIDLCEKFPGAINNGYRHIERVLLLAKQFKLPEKNIIIDVGAADGVISSKFSEAFPKALIYAFEPVKSTFEILKGNVSGNLNIIPVNKALGNSNEIKSIHLAERITSSSIFEIENNISDSYISGQLNYTGDEKIFISRLDEEIDKYLNINIIKIDVQGYELEVLKGAEKTLKRTRLVLLEMQNHNNYANAPEYYILDEYLRNSGFELIDIIPSIRVDNKLYEWDGIYRNKNLAWIK